MYILLLFLFWITHCFGSDDLGVIPRSILENNQITSPNRRKIQTIEERLAGKDPKFVSPVSSRLVLSCISNMQTTPEDSKTQIARELAEAFKGSLEESPTQDTRLNNKRKSEDISSISVGNGARLRYLDYKNTPAKQNRIAVIDQLNKGLPFHEIATLATRHVVNPEIKRDMTGEITGVLGGHSLDQYDPADVEGPCLTTPGGVHAILVGNRHLKTVRRGLTERSTLDEFQTSTPLTKTSSRGQQYRKDPSGNVISVLYDAKTPGHAKTCFHMVSISEDQIGSPTFTPAIISPDGSVLSQSSGSVIFTEDDFASFLVGGRSYTPEVSSEEIVVDVTSPVHSFLSSAGVSLKTQDNDEVKIPVVAKIKKSSFSSLLAGQKAGP